MNTNSCFLQCQSLWGPYVIGVCPAEYSNKCNIAAPFGGIFPDDLCACVQDPSQTIDPINPPTTFCAADSKICKADVNGIINCRDCCDGECPNFAPRCNGAQCLCGTSLPFGTFGTLLAELGRNLHVQTFLDFHCFDFHNFRFNLVYDSILFFS